MADDCIFCKIIKGEIPSTKVYEDDKMIAINDVAPAAPVHVLLMPKDHTANITTADPELVAYMLGKVKMIAGFNQTAEKLFGVELRSEADAFIRLTEIGHRYEKGYKKEKLYKSSSIIFPYIS